jgi:hypothetical protein
MELVAGVDLNHRPLGYEEEALGNRYWTAKGQLSLSIFSRSSPVECRLNRKVRLRLVRLMFARAASLKLERLPGHAGGRGFESRRSRHFEHCETPLFRLNACRPTRTNISTALEV